MSFKLLLCVAFGIGFLANPPASISADAQPISDSFDDIHGRTHKLLSPDENQISVVVFITTDCPIANSYQPTLSRLAKQFREQGVSIYLVHPAKRVSKEAALNHAKEFAIEVPVILDPDQVIARRLAAKVTPEAFVINHHAATVYRGRIDDLYAGFGKKRRKPTQHDLRDAITATLSGQSPLSNTTDAVGCLITYPTKAREQNSVLP